MVIAVADYSKSFKVSYDQERDSCTIAFRCFDTPNTVTVFGLEDLGEQVEDVLLSVRNRCLDYHRLWSFSLPDSDITRINEPVDCAEVDVRTAALIASMAQFHQTEPSFDFTVGPVSYLWKHADELPSRETLEQALAHVGAEKVSVNDGVVQKSDPLVKVDVGGAAKGFVADDIALQLRKAGVRSADIDLGGNLFMVGCHPKGRPWRVSVRVPQGMDVKVPVIELRDRSVVTSGSYERFVEIQGTRYHHIIDARTGKPAETDIVSATVVSPSSLMADMLATTTLIEGSKGFEDLKLRHSEETFIAITGSGRVLT